MRVALLLAFVVAALPMTARAQTTELFPSSLRIPVVEGTAIIECPSQAQGNPSEMEIACIRMPSGPAGTDVTLAYFNALMADRWIFRSMVAPTYIFVRWQNADCIEHLAMGGVENAQGVVAFYRPVQPICGDRRFGGGE